MAEYRVTVLGTGAAGKSVIVVTFVQVQGCERWIERYEPTIEGTWIMTNNFQHSILFLLLSFHVYPRVKQIPTGT